MPHKVQIQMLDDVDNSAIGNFKLLQYQTASGKHVYIDPTGISGGVTGFAAPSGLADSNVTGSGTTVPHANHQHKRDLNVAKAGTIIGTRNKINFIEGSNVTLTVTDDAGGDKVNVTVASTGGLTIQEEDGSPSATVDILKVPNGSFTDNMDGTYTLAIPQLTIQELDGTPAGIPSALKFPNGTITDNMDGTYTYTPAATGTFGTPAFTFDTTNTAGSIAEAVRRDAQIALFDATAPTTQAFGDAAAVGSAGKAARRDHKHAWPTAAITTSGLTQATAKLLGRSTAATGAIEEITLGTNLSFSGTTLNATGGGGTTVATDTIWDAKGDLAVGTGADTAARLPVGADNANLVLTPDSSQSTGLKWATLGTKLIYKTADESVTSSTALQDDDHLSFSIAASETWAVRFVLFVDGATAGDFKPALAGPTSATAQCGVLGVSTTETSFDAAHVHNEGDFGLGGAPILGTLGAGSSTVCYFEGVVFNSTNAGTVKLQWAQGTSSGTATKLLKGSYLMAWKLA